MFVTFARFCTRDTRAHAPRDSGCPRVGHICEEIGSTVGSRYAIGRNGLYSGCERT